MTHIVLSQAAAQKAAAAEATATTIVVACESLVPSPLAAQNIAVPSLAGATPTEVVV